MRTRRNRVGVLVGLGVAAALAGCDDGSIFRNGNGNTPPPGNLTSGNVLGITSAGRLVTFDRASPTVSTAVTISGLQNGETILGIDIRPGGATPGQLYLLGSSGRLYIVNTSTGAATVKSTLAADPADTSAPFTALSGTEFGVDFNPAVDRLRIVSDTGQNLRVNVDTGLTTTDGNLNVSGAARMNVTDAAYTLSFAGTCRTTLFFIDANADRLFTTSDPNAGTLSDVGPLGVDASAVGGFEIATASDGTNTAVATFGTTLYSINLTTGTATVAGAIGSLNSGETIRGITAAPPASGPANTLGGVVAFTEMNKVISFQAGSPQTLCTTIAASGMQSGETILGIDTRPADGAIYALGSSGRIYTLNPTSGALTLKSTLAPSSMTDPFSGLSGTEFGVDFNPVPDRLRVVSDSGQNLRINVDTGGVITDTALNPAGFTVSAAAYTNAFAGAGSTTLFELDAAGDQLVVQGRPSGDPNLGDLQPIGPLNVDIQSLAGFDIAGTNNAAIAAVNNSAGTSDLYTVNLTTGAAARVATINGGERVRGLTMAAIPTATVFGLTADTRLVSFKVNTPGTFDTNNVISGLQGGELVIGIDFRPANGRLYAVTNAGRIYTLNPATGAATAPVNLIADAMDMTPPLFTALSGTNFGVDFNPAVDRLRIVSDTGQNLRVNVDTGATMADGNLTPPAGAPLVVAAAYTSNFTPAPPAAGTTLFDIDLASSTLFAQSPPNDGVLMPVGGVLDPVGGVTFVGTAGFDIAGGDNGLSLAALTPTGGAQTLYRVNLRTGATTSIGALGSTGGPILNGLTIQLK
jgi:trimeric autotransporter adhesin